MLVSGTRLVDFTVLCFAFLGGFSGLWKKISCASLSLYCILPLHSLALPSKEGRSEFHYHADRLIDLLVSVFLSGLHFYAALLHASLIASLIVFE